MKVEFKVVTDVSEDDYDSDPQTRLGELAEAFADGAVGFSADEVSVAVLPADVADPET